MDRQKKGECRQWYGINRLQPLEQETQQHRVGQGCAEGDEHQQRWPAADFVHPSEGDGSQPFVGDPGGIEPGERERVRMRDVPVGQDPLSRCDMPENVAVVSEVSQQGREEEQQGQDREGKRETPFRLRRRGTRSARGRHRPQSPAALLFMKLECILRTWNDDGAGAACPTTSAAAGTTPERESVDWLSAAPAGHDSFL